MANASITTVQFVYKRVIDETIKNSRESFLNEGIEESVLQELRTLWESKVSATRAVEPALNPPDYIPRGQIYKYNYRNQPQPGIIGGRSISQGTNVAGSSGSYQSTNLSAFLPQSMQQPQTITARQQPLAMRQQPLAMRQQPLTVRQQPLAARPPSLLNMSGSSIPSSSTAPQFAQSVPFPSMGGVTTAEPSSAPQQFAPTIPFPSLSGVTTVTKKEFNDASNSIQVDGCSELPICSDASWERLETDKTSSDVKETTNNQTIARTSGKNNATYNSNSGKQKAAIHRVQQGGKRPQQRGRRVRGSCIVLQLDGGMDSDDDAGEFVDSEESEEEENEDTDEEIDVGVDRAGYDLPDDMDKPSSPVEDDEPLNSDDDDSADESVEFEKTDNVVVCLFDKISRTKNKWKLYLKEGVMNIAGKDHVFQKAIGDGEW